MNKNIKRLKKIYSLSLLSLILTFSFYCGSKYNELYSLKDGQCIIRFSPNGGCLNLILSTIRLAKKFIYVQAYCFTSKEIAEELIRAKNKGIDVRILIDKSQIKSKYSMVKYFLNNNISVYIDKVYGIAHNKIIILDGKMFFTGSYNWTKAAEKRNSENLILVKNKKTCNIYLNNWRKRLKNAKLLI